VIYPNADSTLRFGATLSIPPGKGPFPAVVLITGSGPQTRDEEILGHKLFMVLADHLTRNGILVLRADDRGVGKSTGNFSKATSEDFAKDISTHVDYLLSRNEVNKNWIGLIGHSEGGMIAPMVAAARKDIAFLVLMAGPGVKCMDLLVEQNVAIARTAGTSEAAMDGLRTLFRKTANTVLATADMKTAFAGASAAADEWAASTDSTVLQLLGVETKKKRDQYIRSLVLEFQTPWFRYFLQFDPAPWLQKIKCPVLAINGEKDIQVIPAQNLPGMKAALKKSKSKNYEVKELPGLNHLFQTCKTCNTGEYGELEETLSPLALNSISEWLAKIISK
jgi:pimeloyl-ACP methyl ester carboxylesterase